MGILVLEIKPGSPAAKASLKLNDVILNVNGKSVSTPTDMAKELKRFKSGDAISLGFLRDGKKRLVTVTLNGNHDTET